MADSLSLALAKLRRRLEDITAAADRTLRPKAVPVPVPVPVSSGRRRRVDAPR